MIDITRQLGVETASWPGDTPFSIDWMLRLERGDAVSLSRITLSPHTGTHADAPYHYQADGPTTANFDVEAFLGPVRVIDARDVAALGRTFFEAAGAVGQPRVLVRTLDRVRPDVFVRDYPPVEPEAAELLASGGLRLYGTDAPSIDPVDSQEMLSHKRFGGRSIPILENLDLDHAEPGDYDLLALPLRLRESEASPVRAILLPAGSLLLKT